MRSMETTATTTASTRKAFAQNPLRPLIEQLAARLAQEPGVEQIILYGSQATGTARDDSDIDLFIVKENGGNTVARSTLLEEGNGAGNRLRSVQSVIYTPERVRRRLERGDQFVQQILEHGIELYRDPAYQIDEELVTMAKARKDSLYPLDGLNVAEKDWKRATQRLIEGDIEDAAFRLQQALEKYLKAFLLVHGWELQKTHETTKLLREAMVHEPALAPFVELCRRVEEYYLEERYPAETHEAELTHENVALALQEAQALREIILKNLASLQANEDQAS